MELRGTSTGLFTHRIKSGIKLHSRKCIRPRHRDHYFRRKAIETALDQTLASERETRALVKGVEIVEHWCRVCSVVDVGPVRREHFHVRG